MTVRGSGDVCDHPEKYPNGWQTDDVLTVETRYRINVAVGAFSDCQHAHVRPSRLIVACGDGNLVLTHMHWTRWDGHTARGHGTALYNTCSPNCAQGHFGRAPVQATLSRPGYCGSEAVYAYRTLVVDVAGRGRQRAQFSYLCHE